MHCIIGSVRSSRSGNLCPSVTVVSFLEHLIFIFLAQIFKLFSLHWLSSLSALSQLSLSTLSALSQLSLSSQGHTSSDRWSLKSFVLFWDYFELWSRSHSILSSEVSSSLTTLNTASPASCTVTMLDIFFSRSEKLCWWSNLGWGCQQCTIGNKADTTHMLSGGLF